MDVGASAAQLLSYKVPTTATSLPKIQSLSDESLFYIFYTMPRDELQEKAAAELFNRNWRYHKELKTWLTKDLNTPDTAYTKTTQYEKGVYTFWDIVGWCRVNKEFILYYDMLEDRSSNDPVEKNLPTTKVQPIAANSVLLSAANGPSANDPLYAPTRTATNTLNNSASARPWGSEGVTQPSVYSNMNRIR